MSRMSQWIDAYGDQHTFLQGKGDDVFYKGDGTAACLSEKAMREYVGVDDLEQEIQRLQIGIKEIHQLAFDTALPITFTAQLFHITERALKGERI